ncbi:MAG: hypothetical protein HQ582_04645, partial [Planctomycetes bacterium]|nr:hypothetical protein [Planctomycetota bacterium]
MLADDEDTVTPNPYAGETWMQVSDSPTTPTYTFKADGFEQIRGTTCGFADADLLEAVWQAVDFPERAILTPTDFDTELVSLAADSNSIDSLAGLEHAAGLQSLALQPVDLSVSGHLSDLAPIEDLSELDHLTLQACGLEYSELGPIADLTGLESLDLSYNDISVCPDWSALTSLEELDLRYNQLASVPAAITSLQSLDSLYVYGNRALMDDPQTSPEEARTISELAAALCTPVEMYEYVVNTIEFQPYSGAMKGPEAAFQTKRGNSWDTASLLAELFTKAGIWSSSMSYVSGQIYLPIDVAVALLRVADADAALDVLETAGLHPVAVGEQGQPPDGVAFDHVWLEVGTRNYFPCLKYHYLHADARNMLDEVSFDADPSTGAYYAFPRKEGLYEYYSQQVRDYLAANDPGWTVAEVTFAGPIAAQSIDSAPYGLPYDLWDSAAGEIWDGNGSAPTTEYAYADGVPEGLTHRVRISLEYWWETPTPHWESAFTSPTLALPDIALEPITLRPTYSTGGDVAPDLYRNWDELPKLGHTPENLDPDGKIRLTIEHLNPDGDNDPDGAPNIYDRKAGNYLVIALDVDQVSEGLIQTVRAECNEKSHEFAQSPISTPGQGPDREAELDDYVGRLPYLASLEYFYQAGADRQRICDLTAAIPLFPQTASGVVTASRELQEWDGWPDAPQDPGENDPNYWDLQFPYLPEELTFDFGNGYAYLDVVPIVGDDTHDETRRNMVMGALSAYEHSVLEELTNTESFSTIKSLQLAREDSGNQVLNIAAYGSAGVLDSSYDTEFVDLVQEMLDDGWEVWVPHEPTPLGNYDHAGFRMAKETSDGLIVAHVIGGPLYGGVTTGPPETYSPVSSESIGVSDDTQHIVGDPVNIATGSVYHRETDLSFPGLGATLEFSRKYTPVVTSNLGMGLRWAFTYGDRLKTSGSAKVWTTGEGDKLEFLPNGSGGYVTPDSIHGTLSFDSQSGEYVWEDKTGREVVFYNTWLKRIEDRYGNGVEITRDGSNRIDKVSDLTDASRWLDFTYDGSYIQEIEDFTGRTWTYTYTATTYRLTSATAPSDEQTPEASVEYSYYGGLLNEVTVNDPADPDGGTTTFEYYPNGRVSEVIDAEGHSATFSYNLFRNRTAYTDERGVTTYYTYNDRGNLLEERRSNGTTLTYTWEDSLKQSASDAFGQTEWYQYDTDGNLTELTERDGHETTYTYTDYANVATVTREGDPGDSEDDQLTQYSYEQDAQGKDSSLQEIEDAL